MVCHKYKVLSRIRREYVTSEVNLSGTVHDPMYTQGFNLKSAWDVIQYHLDNSFNSIDEDGIYFVYPSPDVKLRGACTSYCGYVVFMIFIVL